MIAKLDGRCYVEGKVSYYYPTDSTFRKIYDERIFYGIEGAFRLINDFYLFSSANLFTSSGHSIGDRDKTRICLIPIEIGVKYFFPFLKPNFKLYVGGSAVPCYLHVKNYSDFVQRKRENWIIGGSFKGGIHIYPWNNCSFNKFYFDIFLDYFLLEKKYKDTKKTIGKKANFNSLSVGGGFGRRF